MRQKDILLGILEELTNLKKKTDIFTAYIFEQTTTKIGRKNKPCYKLYNNMNFMADGDIGVGSCPLFYVRQK